MYLFKIFLCFYLTGAIAIQSYFNKNKKRNCVFQETFHQKLSDCLAVKWFVYLFIYRIMQINLWENKIEIIMVAIITKKDF